MFMVSDMIGHRSADAADEVASCLARGVVLGMSGVIVMIRILHFHNQPDTRMLEFVGDW